MTEETAKEATTQREVKSIGKKTVEKTMEINDRSMQTMHIGSAKDAHDIHALGTTRLEKLMQTLKIQWLR